MKQVNSAIYLLCELNSTRCEKYINQSFSLDRTEPLAAFLYIQTKAIHMQGKNEFITFSATNRTA